MVKIQDIRDQTPKRSSRHSVSRIEKIARHHTATTDGDFWSFWNNRWKGLGWKVGGYHEIILRDGTVQLCYDPTVITNGVGNHNSSTYHIALVGNGSFNNIQEQVWQERAKVALKRFNLTGDNVLGHNEFSNQNTQCPGIDMAKIRSLLKGDTPNMTILRKGDKGENVKKLQESLVKAGEKLPRFGADGDFGTEAETALKTFQLKHGLTVDGIAGSKTLAKLEEVLLNNSSSNSFFKDVSADHWAYEAIEFVREQGIMSGFDDQTFKPEEKVTRAQLATVIQNLKK